MADALPPPAARGRSNLPKFVAAVAAVAAVLVVLLVTGVIGGDDDDDGGEQAKAPTPEELVAELRRGKVLIGPTEAPFAMRYTNDWRVATEEALPSGEPGLIASLRRKDDSGLLNIKLGGPLQGGIAKVQRELPTSLARRFPDFRLQTIERIQVAAGPALYTSWTRTDSGRVQSQLVVPVANERSFSVDVVLSGGASDAAAEVGAMFRTFDTAPAAG